MKVELLERTFKDSQEWTAWLELEGASSPGVWMRIAKAGAPTSSLQHAAALDIALCFGWIDGQNKRIDAHYWLQKFTPRSARSIWSKVNRDKVQALIEQGLMREAGLKEIERAQRDGRWAAAYDSWSAATVPEDLQASLDASPAAARAFSALNGQNRYAILFRTHTAKRAETRSKRISQFVAMLERGETIYPQEGFTVLRSS